eukprot:TRINITY_DN16557_c0_g1_i1.p1 TRINITY_DN16557_c0_g1~~TRINITY_DN16557_c0_g1_i1.p1  ORF type:complete len:295 (+),score=47.14 TRINITY_DN16557_c0_g1_i1:57-941(+)
MFLIFFSFVFVLSVTLLGGFVCVHSSRGEEQTTRSHTPRAHEEREAIAATKVTRSSRAIMEGMTGTRALLRPTGWHGTHDMFETYLCHGGSANSTDRDGVSILAWAAGSGRTPIVRLLLEHNALAGEENNGLVAFHVACAGGYRDICGLLLEHSPHPRVLLGGVNEFGRTGAHIAAFFGHTQLLSFLFSTAPVDQRAVLMNARDNDNLTPLMRAVCRDQHETVCFLLSCGAESDVVGRNRFACMSALAIAEHRNCHSTRKELQKYYYQRMLTLLLSMPLIPVEVIEVIMGYLPR